MNNHFYMHKYDFIEFEWAYNNFRLKVCLWRSVIWVWIFFLNFTNFLYYHAEFFLSLKSWPFIHYLDGI